LKISSDERDSVFLNIPYDPAFERLYLAYIAGIHAFNLVPRATRFNMPFELGLAISPGPVRDSRIQAESRCANAL